MAKPEREDPCAADHVTIGPGGSLTLRVRFDPFTLFLAVPARDGSTTDIDVTEKIVRYEFTEKTATLVLAVEPPPDRRIEARQRTGTRDDWGPLEPITVPANNRCIPVEFKIWDAAEPEPVSGTVPQLSVKPRKHSPQTGTSKDRPRDR